jgi:hypothetical protein
MSMEERPFAPLYNRTALIRNLDGSATKTQVGSCVVSVTVAAVDAAAVASTEFPGTANNQSAQIQIANKTSVWVHVNFGNITAPNTVRAATINDFPVAPGSVSVVTVDPEVNAASVFANGAPAASTSVMFTRGSGT